MPRLSSDVVALRERIVSLRRTLHQNPELSWAEHRTAQQVCDFLEGAASVRSVAGTGLLATIGAERGPAVLLRVDMDALPIQEQSAASYASRVPGVMHACGHDGHVAMGVAAAHVLAGRRPAGRTLMLFQPAEEAEGGAQAVVADGVLEDVRAVLGVHLWNELPVGTLGVKAGPLMAAVDRLRIEVHGRGGHGGKPHRSADPVVAAAHVVTALQTVVARETSPLHSAVVTIASIHGGEAFNVIPDEVTLTGTLRTFDADVRASLPERLARIATGVAGALGCRAEVEVRRGNPAVVNDPAMAALARRAAVSVVGEEKVREPEPTMGGEDMAVYFEKAPGCFVFVGSSNAARGLDQPHHSPRFDFDEDALLIGTEFLVQAAEEALAAAR
jgi:amidohydrolase